MSRGAYVIVIEDETELAAAYAEYLSDLGYRVDAAESGQAYDRLVAANGPPDLMVLDLNLPGESGGDILRRIGPDRGFPVLIASAIDDPMERIVTLELGADDYVVKPVVLRELAARIAGLLARFGHAERRLVRFESVLVDLTGQRLLRGGQAAEPLGPGEVALIRAFVEHPDRVLTREALIELAPGEDDEVYDRAIDTRVSRLRRKLDTATIRTARGHGYVYEPFQPRAARAPGSSVEED